MSGASMLAIQQQSSTGEQERMDEVMFSARGDLERALNYASLEACNRVGQNPLVSSCDDGDCDTLSDNVENDVGRITELTTAYFDEYVDANYPPEQTSGQRPSAVRTGDIKFEEICGEIERSFRHPLWPARDEAPVYYVASVPVNITIPYNGGQTVVIPVNLETIVTSRYPLLRALTDEYEERLNGASPFTLDVTAGTIAYTWARGYMQYATNSPDNIIENEHMTLMANGAMLLEQASTFNAVDPMSLAHFGVETLLTLSPDGETPDRYAELMREVGKTWWMEHQDIDWQRDAFISTGDADSAAQTVSQYRSYNLNLSQVVQNEWQEYLAVDGLGVAIDETYTACLELNVERIENYRHEARPSGEGWSLEIAGTWEVDSLVVTDVLLYPEVDATILECTNYSVLRSRWNTYALEGSNEIELARECVAEYIWLNVSCRSYATSAGSSNDIASPFVDVRLDGVNGYRDTNLKDALSVFKCDIGLNDSIGYGEFRTLLYEILTNNRSLYPNGTAAHHKNVICSHEHWVEYVAWEHLQMMREIISGMSVTLREDDYTGPREMLLDAGYMLEEMLHSRWEELLDRGNFTNEEGEFESAGAKAVYAAGHSYLYGLFDVSSRFEESAMELEDTIDGALNNTAHSELNANNLSDVRENSRSLLDYVFVIPLGDSMNLTFPGEPGWSETVLIGLDQSPDYLNTSYYEDEYTGYGCYPMKVKNICLFTLQLGDVADLLIGTGFDMLNEEVLGLIDALFSSADEFVNTTIGVEVENIVSEITRNIGNRIVEELDSRFANDTEICPIFDREDLSKIISEYLDRFSSEELFHMLSDGSLVDGIVDTLVEKRDVIAAYLAGMAIDYLDEYVSYLSEKLGELAREACVDAISSLLKDVKIKIQQLYIDFSAELEREVKEGAGELLSEFSGLAFSGLPVLPPFGWWFTINVWYVEVQGDIPSFVVYDANNHPHHNALFGHQPQVYVREFSPVFDANGTLLGYNQPIHYKVETASFIMVPACGGGVGDRTGGWEEASEGFYPQE